MSGSEQELQEEIKELRGELGETVQALVHKADVPARAKERGHELTDQAKERGSELKDRVVVRGRELRGQVIERGSELKDQATAAAEGAREAASQTSAYRWAKLAGVGLVIIAFTVIVRKVRTL